MIFESSDPALPPGFALFWTAYPRKVSKVDALRAWRQVRAEENSALQTLILLRLEEHKAQPQWQKERGQYIPYPASWLRQRRWEDDLSGPRLAPMVNPDVYVVPEDGPRPEGSCRAWHACKGMDAGNGYCLYCQVFLPVDKRVRPQE